jgi:predicted O-linked N-acetylglucosamine transferase (SPINDLY family)
LCYLPPAGMPGVGPLPALGRDGCVTFGSFSRTARINPRVIALWARLLDMVPGSRLVLNAKPFVEEAGRALFRARFAGHGIAAERLELIYTAPQPRTWAAYNDIDIALDPFPHNAGTTTVEALWMGVPVVSLAGRPSVGRFGASILGSVGLAEWVAATPERYVAMARSAAADLDGLARLRAGLRARVEASPLRDGPGLARAIEAAYRQLWRRWCAGPDRTGPDRTGPDRTGPDRTGPDPSRPDETRSAAPPDEGS